MNQDRLAQLLERVQSGKVTVPGAIDNGFGAGCLAHRINAGMSAPQKTKKVR